MSKRFRNGALNQAYLLPPSLQGWLPEGHLARFVADLVETLDLSARYAKYAEGDGRGRSAYDPRMMVRLLIYADAPRPRCRCGDHGGHRPDSTSVAPLEERVARSSRVRESGVNWGTVSAARRSLRQVLGQVIRQAHLLDEAQLRFQVIGVTLLVLEVALQQFRRGIVSGFGAEGGSLVIFDNGPRLIF